MTLTESLPNDSVLIDGTMPGSSPMKPMKLPLTLGSCVSVSLVMLPPISFDVTSTRGASPETVTVSSMPPTCSATSIVDVLPTSRARSRRLNFLNPCSSATTSYVPGTRLLAMNEPSAALTVSRYMPVA